MELSQEIKPALQLMFRENFNNNSKFIFSHLNEIFQTYHRSKEIISNRQPHFLKNPKKFYYLIAHAPILSFTLKRIVIRGLWNLDSIAAYNENGHWIHTLFIKNVNGRMILDYGSKNETPLKLKFHIDYLNITQQTKDQCVRVSANAKCYNVKRAKAKSPLTIQQTEVIMNGLESAISSAIFSSLKGMS